MPQRSQKALASGSIRLHRAWDDTTALTRISEQNDGASRSLIAYFVCKNGLGSRALVARISVTMPPRRKSLGVGLAGNHN
jgi:hypothetical protein